MTTLIPTYRPGLIHGTRPERRGLDGVSDADRALARTLGRLRGGPGRFGRFRRQLKQIAGFERELPAPGTRAWTNELLRLRQALRREGLTEALILQCFAAICRGAEETLGLNPHPVQRFGGWVMLQGAVAEMHTGEGKTLTAALPAITMALAGVPVHVVTVNDYLVARDAAKLLPLYECFGLTVGTITEDSDETARREAYASNVLYCSNKQLVFDYLRDLQRLQGHRFGKKSQLASLISVENSAPLMRGLCFAIVDEADSVLIDEARTPLILAEQKQDARSAAAEAAIALSLARSLHQDVDFKIDQAAGAVNLTPMGAAAIRQSAASLSGVWRFERYRVELIRQALRAQHLFRRDRDYLVQDGKVVLIDEQTGRVMADRKLQHGLHRLLEVKEKCEVTADNEVVAALSFQQFFARYGALAGMSGTLKEVRAELARVYGLDVVPVPPHRRLQRKDLPPLIFADRETQLKRLIEEVRSRHRTGQPVLIGTRSVALSELVSDRLQLAGLPNQLLNARQDQEEAEVVAQAGQLRAITVATNMAGRGTDIPLGAGVAAAGGLHVINAEINDSRRVDRQLFGRSARQGDPGSAQAILCLQDELLSRAFSTPLLRALRLFVRLGGLGRVVLSMAVHGAQARRERAQARVRESVRQRYASVRRQLSFVGEME